ncbi:MAG: SMC family ATPase [Acidimicrobiales bacterium]|nr:MAG: SMC family ATPase [Acidimicrobiales bacterium]
MRPIRLELKGFSAFRESTVIDFENTDLFALVGPTGSGKSSIIDGIVFALYGSVARYRKANLVAPSVNQLSAEARVRLDFLVAGKEYSAVRVVRRTAAGATTKEARLESGDKVLAGNKGELDTAIEELLGLDFNQFTKTVVLPQGDFARFLTENSADRQSLLRRLLGMELYRRIGSAARDNAKNFTAQADALAEQVAGASAGGVAELKQLTARRKKLEKTEATVSTAVGERIAAVSELETAEDAAADIERQVELLRETTSPKPVATLAAELAKAGARVESHTTTVATATTTVEELEVSLSELEDPDHLEEVVEAHDDLAETKKAEKSQARELAAASRALDNAITQAEAAAKALDTAHIRAREARIRAGATGLIEQLRVGESCPVCNQVVSELPTHDPAGELDALDAALEQARVAASDAGATVTATTTAEASSRSQLDATRDQRDQLAEKLEGQPTKPEAKKLLAAVLQQSKKLVAARESLDAVVAARQEAVEHLEALSESEFDLRHEYGAARDLLAELGPPAPGGTNLAEDWAALAEFAKQTYATKSDEYKKATATVAAATKAVAACDRTIARVLKPLVDDAIPEHPERWIVTELSRAAADEAALIERRDLLAKSQEQIDALRRDGRVASELGRLVSATGFEQWLMVDVMDDLARRATVRLFELSGGAYSLISDSEGSEFAIRDHRNADEVRPARTLSGGETFLASLALALALADSVAELSPEGVPPIESMFLDEGFGTLDSETLDVVASAIEELGAAGRMVGVVTHIRELADRVPVRFEVSRSPATSSVVRSEAV